MHLWRVVALVEKEQLSLYVLTLGLKLLEGLLQLSASVVLWTLVHFKLVWDVGQVHFFNDAVASDSKGI